MFAILDKVPGPPPGCESRPCPAEYYRGGGDDDAFNCPLLPMSIRNHLTAVAENLDSISHTLLDDIFGKELRSGISGIELP